MNRPFFLGSHYENLGFKCLNLSRQTPLSLSFTLEGSSITTLVSLSSLHFSLEYCHLRRWSFTIFGIWRRCLHILWSGRFLKVSNLIVRALNLTTEVWPNFSFDVDHMSLASSYYWNSLIISLFMLLINIMRAREFFFFFMPDMLQNLSSSWGVSLFPRSVIDTLKDSRVSCSSTTN